MHLYDAHQHFHFDQLTPHRAAIDVDLRAIGLKGAVVNGTNTEEWPVVAQLAKDYAWVRPSFGIHPWDAGNRAPDWHAELSTQLLANQSAGVGEIGLDRWLLELKPDDPRVTGPLSALAAVLLVAIGGRWWTSGAPSGLEKS
ncbi:MAG: TatD family hydrolase [bacterium]|nr:TatD family hydrolase [bacterium]